MSGKLRCTAVAPYVATCFVCAGTGVQSRCCSQAYLEHLPTVLNPSAFEQLWKDVTHELGQIYAEIIELKM